jgi:hypothetical protein
MARQCRERSSSAERDLAREVGHQQQSTFDQEDAMRMLVPVIPVSLLGLALALACSDGTGPTGAARPAFRAGGRSGFGFEGSVSGAPTGVVRLAGGGSFDPGTASNTVPAQTSVVAAGGFRCADAVAQGPLIGCETGQGVRWDTAQLLASTPFKCTGADALKTATTDAHTAVLSADFYRAGDGNEESFTAPMFVADEDLAPDLPGVQNLWIQGVGCGTAIVNFN